MKYKLTYSTTLQAAHRLPMVPEKHPCRRLHGHTYHVDIAITGPLGADGFVIDYYAIEATWKGIHESLDHQYLNERFNNPTTEILAGYILHEMEFRLPAVVGVHVVSIRISENDQHCCTVLAEISDLRAEPEKTHWTAAELAAEAK